MSALSCKKKNTFYLPRKGILEPNNYKDPIKYYYHPLVGFLYRARIRQALSLLNPNYDSILELGFGSGILMPSLASIGKAIFGIDIDSDPGKVMSNLQRIGVHASLMQGDICNLNYPDESFDLVVAISILEHISQVELVINKVFCILRPRGHFLVGMPRVSKFMETAFTIIGYPNIEKDHVTDYKRFLKSTDRFFKLEKFKKIPAWANESMSLYFNMLFSKR